MQRKPGTPCYPGMQDFHFRAIPGEVALQARRTLRDSYGHALRIQSDQTAPCRLCLRIATPGEALILLSHNPFGADHGPYSEVGPIFVHADACAPYADVRNLPTDFAARALVLRAYNRQHAIEDSLIAQPGEAMQSASRLFANPLVAYIHVRHTTYGCFDFAIERD
ncbi:MAG: DUF1203 domain-containing protein [Vulcanimicrobiaceae bacterium]